MNPRMLVVVLLNECEHLETFHRTTSEVNLFLRNLQKTNRKQSSQVLDNFMETAGRIKIETCFISILLSKSLSVIWPTGLTLNRPATVYPSRLSIQLSFWDLRNVEFGLMRTLNLSSNHSYLPGFSLGYSSGRK